VSALAHRIESRGIATVVIGLVRKHLEKTANPRSLWVPFPLGRPLGEPGDAAFQRRVLLQALHLLERRDGPVILEDFADDAPSMRDDPAWQPAFRLEVSPAPPVGDREGWARVVAAEIARVRPRWEAAREQSGRTTVGVSSLPAEAWADYLAAFLTGDVPESPVAGLSAAVLARHVADDLKAYYMEAARGPTGRPSIGQINDWFWNGSLAADLLRALRTLALASPHKGFATAGGRFLVPAPYVEKA
jgi:hypothetical protein